MAVMNDNSHYNYTTALTMINEILNKRCIEKKVHVYLKP